MAHKSFVDSIKNQKIALIHKKNKIKFNDIRTDGGTQNRVVMDEKVINEYAEAMLLENSNFRPIVLFQDKKDIYWLADGFHRLEAMKLNGLTEAECIINKGQLRDAILYSLSANATHGLRRTNEDKRKAVMTLLHDNQWKKLSTRKLAKMAGVSNMMIGKLKNEIGLDVSDIIGNDGRKYNMETTVKDLHSEKKTTTRKKYFRLKMKIEYKDKFDKIKEVSNYTEEYLLREAFKYIEEKYLNK